MQNTQLQPIPQSPQANNTLYISSLEIAERTGKQHKTVLRDIRNMLVKLYGDEFIKKDNPDLFDAVQAHFKDGTDLYHQDQRGFACSNGTSLISSIEGWKLLTVQMIYNPPRILSKPILKPKLRAAYYDYLHRLL